MKHKKFCLVMIFLFLLSNAFAATNFEDITIIVEDLDKDVSSITYRVTLSGSETVNITLRLAKERQGINVYYKDTFERPNYYVEDKDLNLEFQFDENQSKTIVIKSYVEKITKTRNGEEFVFLDFNIEDEFEKFDIILMLPEGATVSDVEDSSVLFPKPTRIISDGKQIIFNWKKSSFSGEFEILLNYETNSGNNYFYLFYVILGLIITILLLVWFLKTKNKNKIKQIITVGLSEDEKKIYNFIKEKRKVKQKEVLEKFDFSKPRLSKMLRGLEEKDLISKKPMGRTNLLEIKNI